MFADPTSVTIGATITPSGGTATSLSRIRTDGYASEYRSADGLTGGAIKHQLGKRYRSEVRFDKNATYVDPTTGLTIPVSTSVYAVINRPTAGFTNTDIKNLILGLAAYLGVTANLDKILAFES